MKTTIPMVLEGLPQAARGLALQTAVRQAADDLAARFSEMEGFRRKVVYFPEWAKKEDFGAEIRFRRGVAAGFDVRVSVSPKDRDKVAINVARSARIVWLVVVPAMVLGVVAAYWLTADVEFHDSRAGWLLVLGGILGGGLASIPVVLLIELLFRAAGRATSDAELDEVLMIVQQAVGKTVGG